MLFETYVNTLALMNCYICLNGPYPDSCRTNCDIAPSLTPKRNHSRIGCPPLTLAPDHPLNVTTDQKIREYQTKARTTLNNFKGLWKETGWELKERDEGLGDVNIIESENYATVWSLTMEVDVRPCVLIADMLEILKNPTIKTSELYVKITDTLGITYMTTPSYPGISQRDFVDLAEISEEDGTYFCTYESIEGVKPEVEGLVRAINRPSGIIMEPVYYDNITKTKLTWIINNDYKLNYILQLAAKVMFPQNLRKIMQFIKDHVEREHN